MSLLVKNHSLKDNVFPWLDVNGAFVHLFVNWTLSHGPPKTILLVQPTNFEERNNKVEEF